MPRCAFLSTDNLEGFYVYDDRVVQPLAEHGWQVDTVSWHNRNVDWNQYQVVVVRSTWDYQQHLTDFLACLARIEQSNAVLENSLAVQRWNIDKIYLRDLQQARVGVIDTLWFEAFDLAAIQRAVADKGWQEYVIKPRVSAGSDATYRLTATALQDQATQLANEYIDRPFMVQPFIEQIVQQGEYSLFYFNGEHSHAILKSPVKGDFRVQEEFGGQLQLVQASQQLRDAGRAALQAVPGDTLYARVDLVDVQGQYQVMEVELIEPSLYFNMDPKSPQRFAHAFAKRFSHF